MRTFDLFGEARARSRFEAGCEKSGVMQTSPHLNHLKFYQKIAKALARYLRALIHVLSDVELWDFKS